MDGLFVRVGHRCRVNLSGAPLGPVPASHSMAKWTVNMPNIRIEPVAAAALAFAPTLFECMLWSRDGS